MNRNKLNKSLLLLLLVSSFSFYPFLDASEIKGDNLEPFFNIALLVSGSVWEKIACAQLMIDELANIGIGVYEFDTDLSNDLIYRTWWHTPPIPAYENGGFDILNRKGVEGNEMMKKEGVIRNLPKPGRNEQLPHCRHGVEAACGLRQVAVSSLLAGKEATHHRHEEAQVEVKKPPYQGRGGLAGLQDNALPAGMEHP